MNEVEPIRDRKTLKKVERILAKQSSRDLLLFVIGTNTGLRVSDILSLNVEDVKNKDFIDIIEKKTGKHKKFPLNEKIKTLLQKYTLKKRLKSPLFTSMYNKRLDRTNAYRIVNKACRKIGMKEKIGTHTMRKTFGYHHYHKFKDVALLQKIFNHYSPSVTLRYIGIDQEEINNSYLNFIL